EDGAVRGGTPCGGGDAEHKVPVERRRVGGGELGRDHDPGPAQRRGAAARQRRDDLLRHAREVLRAGPHVLVVERAIVGGDRGGGVVPGLRRVLAFLEDRTAGGGEQRLVVEEEQMRVEDGRAVVARPRRDGVARG